MMKRLIKNLSNLPGWRTPKKIIVFESDDWGSIRMPSLGVFGFLKSKGLDLEGGDADRYNRNDTLASKQDFVSLFEVLSKFKDLEGNFPVFTAISLCANPDFERIKKSEFSEYFHEPLPVTLERYGIIDAWPLWKEGRENKLFVPEFHGREHLNVACWMRALQNGDKHTVEAFKEAFWGFNNQNPYNVSYQAAFDLERREDLNVQKKAIIEGLDLFEQLHGYKASFFVPPNGPFNNSLEKVAANHGVKFMSAAKLQREPQGQGVTKLRLHYLGQKNKWGQRYITRNAFFEPSQKGKDWVDSCLHDIDLAFRWRKPAVISTHRVNYIGGLDVSNRDNGLKELNRLIHAIMKKWLDVQFMTSTELGHKMNGR